LRNAIAKRKYRDLPKSTADTVIGRLEKAIKDLLDSHGAKDHDGGKAQ